jgi:N-acetyl-anhydromuramyl-L-alanine amidase AmpD
MVLKQLQSAALSTVFSLLATAGAAHATASVSALSVKQHNVAKSLLVKHAKPRNAAGLRHHVQPKQAKTVVTSVKHVAHSGADFKPMKLSKAQQLAIRQNFASGQAAKISPDQLLRAGVFSSYSLRGGVFKRHSEIQNIVMHSTETASVADAKQIIRSWNNGGANHPGTQYIVDRDGTIYQTVNPAMGTFHVNSFKTLEGVKNDNSVGIEIVRTGSQQYTPTQLKSVVCLVGYLKEHFSVNHIWGHGEIQPSDRTDPVAFDWTSFHSELSEVAQMSLAKAHKPDEGGRLSAALKQSRDKPEVSKSRELSAVRVGRSAQG